MSLAVLALDHRNNLRNALRPHAPETLTAEDLVAFKLEVTSCLAAAASAVLLDPEVGVAQTVAGGTLPGQVGLIIALEATGYTGDPNARQSTILPGWSVRKARRAGASAVKLLVYYHPDSPTAAQIEQLVSSVAADCKEEDLPLFLEPLSYSLDPIRKKLSANERHRVVIETARRLTVPGVDVLKAEFPLDIQAQPEEREWANACAELTEASSVPWILLSASISYEIYIRQVAIACQQGASGVAVGRAVWQEATQLQGKERVNFLSTIARERMRRLTELCDALARPWTETHQALLVSPDWYKTN